VEPRGLVPQAALWEAILVNGVDTGLYSNGRQSIAVAAARVRADIAFAALDIFVVVAAYTLGLALRMLDPLVVDAAELWSNLALAIPVIVVVHLSANVLAGAYGHVWEHASTNEAGRVLVANVAASGTLILLNWWVRQLGDFLIPYSVLVVGGLVSLFAMGLVRFRTRLFSFHKATGSVKVGVVGTKADAVAFSRQVPDLEGGRRVVGFISPESQLANGNRRLAGLEVIGVVEDLPDLVDSYDLDEVVVVGGDSRMTRTVVDLCLEIDVRLRMLPTASEMMQTGASAVDVRDISVEDLLERQVVETDLAAVRELIDGKRILVTGAGGSIGSEVVRQILDFDPTGVWALDRDESLLHDAQLTWEGTASIELADIRDAKRLIRLFEEVRPQVVFHAAALKHVPVLEDFPEEAVLTNVVGTRDVIEAGSRVGMERFVLISTDKAVSPTSVMGATKRIAELMTQLGNARDDGCVYTSVRFGNVLGSRGSVIPTFVRQIQNGGPVTVTDPGMTRYFMTVDEAVQLVLQASALAEGSEIFLLDMGEPVRIETLARRLIRLAGLSPGQDIEIEFTGRRPGEKLVETLALGPLQPTSNNRVLEAHLDAPQPHALMTHIADLEELARSGHTEDVISLLKTMTAAGFADRSSSIALEEEDVRQVSSWS
jgi:FlaA1/EpsC-like NDP-sugar epimerase